ncbi:hypothetical protein GCM10011374_01840 [Kocuria dechangensis]|uniref:DUF3499 domain-containing protein n=1 Tax=Kocuria dechangensis TaxID=1176249 RepID=A0A917GFB9_9MICC|nr:DUF3499 family protein [Kocuria dechangensis]GGG43084.1 hypothetical protein GCM10011374_01840 [Kocuria dechangensis]
MSSSGSSSRRCSRQTCTRDAVTTLTYVYSDSTAVVGPLAAHAEPHAYDLCAVHADRLTVPRGWRVVRLELPEALTRRDDLDAVAEAVREPEPAPAVRERPRAALRDVSLPRPPARRGGTAARTGAAVEAGPRTPGALTPGALTPGALTPGALTSGAGEHDVPEHDVPLPEALRRPHLRRPAAGQEPAGC